MAERTVKHLRIRYYEEVEDAVQLDDSGKPRKVLVQREASVGETVDIPRDVDVKRLEELGAVMTEEEMAEAEEKEEAAASGEEDEEADAPGSSSSLAGKSEQELADYIKEEGPTVNQLLEEAHNNPGLAEKILAAENKATDNDPRTSLVAGLQKIISDRNQ